MSQNFSLIVIGILSGWLFSEIKEFIVNGGLDNKLATILIKIIFIVFGIVFFSFSDFILGKFFTISGTIKETITPTQLAVDKVNCSLRSISKTRRTRFTDFCNSE